MRSDADGPVAPTFVGRERDALAEADEDDQVIFEETPIEIDYAQDQEKGGSAIREGSATYWVLEYEKALIKQESISAKRAIRTKIRDELLKKALADRIAKQKEDGKREVEAAKRSVQENIESLKRELAALRGERTVSPISSAGIFDTFTHIGKAAAPAGGRRRTLDDEGFEDEIAELDVLIARRKAETQRTLAVMRKEVATFGSHLATEAKAIIAMQRKKRVAKQLVISTEQKSPEALNGIVVQLESAYDSLF
jgi:hypothetical protein